jgi:hypothetical protein
MELNAFSQLLDVKRLYGMMKMGSFVHLVMMDSTGMEFSVILVQRTANPAMSWRIKEQTVLNACLISLETQF